MSKLLCNVLKISEGGQMPQMPPPLVARLHQTIAFFLTFVWCNRNDVTNKLQISCRLQISTTVSNLSFRGRRELSTGWRIKTTWPSVTVARRVTRGGEKRRSPSQILNCIYWTVEQKLSWPRTANYSLRHSEDSWYFAEVSALEMTAE